MATRALLAIDTAGARCSVCLFDIEAGSVLARADPDIGRGHAERLLELLDEVMTSAGLGFADIGRIAVTVGPGSFTGVRVGVAAARGLALALCVPAIGVNTLEALAEPHWRGEDHAVLASIDAKRGEIYAALYGRGGTVVVEPAALAPADLAAFLGRNVHAGDGPVLVGSGARIVADALGRPPVMTGSGEVDIASVARIGATRADPGAPRPLYLRGADAKPQPASLLRT